MRPIRLKMSAFGAYAGTVDLDFERGLGGENFFLIHGATGSGKTTILDAICYALYGESSGGGRKGSMMRSEQATPNIKTEVEFTFALREKIYRIRRSPQYMRPKFRGGGLTEEKASAEIFVDGNRIETRDVSEYVRELLHFDSEQFRQVVVLPQGAFQKFLLARSDARQAVLNTLFNAEFFKRVEDELKLKMLAARNEFETLSARKNNLLDEAGGSEAELPAQIKTLADEIDAAQARIKLLEAQALDAQKKFSDGEKISAMFTELDTKSRALLNAQRSMGKISDELSAAKIELDKRTAQEARRKELEQSATDLGNKKSALTKLKAKRRELKSALNAAEDSAAEVTRLKKLKQNCDDLMAELTAEVERLQDAPAQKISAEKILSEAQARERLLREIADLRGKISVAEKNLSAATQAHDAAEKRLAELRRAQADGSAARLAATLEDGKPCPVCGAIHHPQPAKSDAAIPTDAQIKSAESQLRRLADEKNSAAEFLATLKGQLDTRQKTLAEGAQVVTVAEAQAQVDKFSAAVKTLESDRSRIKRGEVKTSETLKQLEDAQSAATKLSESANTLRGEVTAMERELDAKYLANPALLDDELAATIKLRDELNAAFKAAQENFNRLNAQSAAQRATVNAAQKNRDELAAQVDGHAKPDLPALKKLRDDSRAAERAAVNAGAKLSAKLERLRDLAKKISALADELNVAEKNFLMWKTLSDVANGKTSKISFQRYYLATMFGEVIAEANIRLERMSGGRYLFKRKEDVTDRRYSGGLDLEIVDDYTGTARHVETLSGGESFLASLSLALGLAAVVQNNAGGIKLDTIFIDEGFGTLDTETLDFAMKTLLDLQSGGRLVGIISHVEELKNQMPVRLEVTKGKTGSYAKFERGLSVN